MKTNTLLVIGVLIVVVVGGWFVLNEKDGSEQSETVKIGLILPLTGDLAHFGEAGQRAASLAIEEINANTGFSYNYELVIEDDSFDARKTASALNKLISVDRVDAVVSVGSGPGNVVAPIVEKNKIPHIGLASDPVVSDGEYNFIHWTRPQEEVDTMLTELKERGLTQVAVMGVNHQGFQAITDDFKAKASKAGITIVSDQLFNTGETDFKTVIVNSQRTNPDVYLLGAFSPEVEILAKQMKELGITKPLTSIESFGLSATPEVFEGHWFIDSAVVTGGFSDKYRAKYNAAVGPTAANIYDALNLIVLATEEAGKDNRPTGTDIAVALGKVKGYSGAFGPLSVSPEGQFISQPSVKIISNGKPTEVE